MDLDKQFTLARSGDHAAKEVLFSHLLVSFRSFIRLKCDNYDDAEEVVQSALSTIVERFATVAIHSSFAAWAQTVIKNEWITFYRKRSLIRRKLADESERRKSIIDRAPKRELKRGLKECLVELHRENLTFARVLNLHYQGYTTGEICEKLEISTTNFYVILSRARTKLSDCLKKKGVLGG